MKVFVIMILLMGMNSVASASLQSIGSYTSLSNGDLSLTTNSVDGEDNTQAAVKGFLGITTLNGYSGGAVKGFVDLDAGQEFSFDWSFFTTWTDWDGAEDYDDFAFVSLKFGGIEVFTTLAKASDSESHKGHFEWLAEEAGILEYGIGIMHLGKNIQDSSLTISNLNPVPLPAAAWFFLTGLLGLAGFKQKRSAI